jgi:hypothetical protein
MRKQKNIQVVIIEPKQMPRLETIPNTLEAKQKIVGGMIEKITLNSEVDMLVNEEGLYLGLEPNFQMKDLGLIVGTVMFLGYDQEGNFRSLADDWAELIMDTFTGKREKNDRTH